MRVHKERRRALISSNQQLFGNADTGDNHTRHGHTRCTERDTDIPAVLSGLIIISNTPPTAPCAVLENDHAFVRGAVVFGLFLVAGTRTQPTS